MDAPGFRPGALWRTGQVRRTMPLDSPPTQRPPLSRSLAGLALRHSLASPLVLLLAAVAGSATPVSAQSAREVLERALEAHRERMEGIRDYTLVQEAFGIESTLYFQRVDPEGPPVFDLRRTIVSGAPMGTMRSDMEPGERTWADPQEFLPELAERARYEGLEAVQGRRAHKLFVDDFTGIDFTGSLGASGEGEFVPRTGTFYLDAGGLVMLRMELDGTMASGGETRDVSAVILMDDYRSVEGMLQPFRMRMTVEGMVPEDVSEQDLEEARRNMEELKKQLDALPESMRGMLESQMESLEQLVGSGTMEVTITVRELRVNTGPPSTP